MSTNQESPSPTATSTFTPPPPPTGNNGGGFSSIFQSPGGPPLILVCIAAGLLLGAFIGVLLMRRMRPTPDVAQHMRGLEAFLNGGLKLGEKPKLLDVHLLPAHTYESRSTPETEERVGSPWATLSPFAAVFLPSPSPSADSQTATATTPEAEIQNPLVRILTRLRRSTPLSRSRSRLHAVDHDGYPAPTFTSSNGVAPQLREVQLAVMVSMPSPRHPVYVTRSRPRSSMDKHEHELEGTCNTLGHNKDSHGDFGIADGEMPDCCIGTAVVSYPHLTEDEAT